MKRGRLFWRIYRHSLFNLLGLAVLICCVVWLSGRRNPWAEKHVRLSQLISEGLAADGDRARLQQRLDDFAFIAGTDLVIYGEGGALIASSGDAPPPLTPEQLADVDDFDHVDGRTHALRLSPPHYLVARWKGRHFLQPFLTLLAGILGLFALLAWPLARSIARPLEQIAATARAIGAGDLTARTGVTGKGETAQLAAAIDEMATRIQSLREREKALLADVSHELRTPIARIKVALEWAEEEGDLPAPLADASGDLAELESLVTDILTAARLDPETATFTLELSQIEAGALVERAVERARRSWPAREFTVDCAPSGFQGDARLLDRVLANLLSNAVRYSDADAPIAVSARPDTDGWRIAVADRGIGVPEGDLKRIFEPFFRGDASRARATGGAGLGLTLCKRIVAAHGGQIRAHNRAGGGLEVSASIPA